LLSLRFPCFVRLYRIPNIPCAARRNDRASISNYVSVTSSGSYSTAGGGTSVSGPTVDQAASSTETGVLSYTQSYRPTALPPGSSGCTPQGVCLLPQNYNAPSSTSWPQLEAVLFSIGAIGAGVGLIALLGLAAGSVALHLQLHTW